MPQVVLDTFFSNDRSVLVSNEDEKGAPALVVLDTFFSNDCSVLAMKMRKTRSSVTTTLC